MEQVAAKESQNHSVEFGLNIIQTIFVIHGAEIDEVHETHLASKHDEALMEKVLKLKCEVVSYLDFLNHGSKTKWVETIINGIQLFLCYIELAVYIDEYEFISN